MPLCVFLCTRKVVSGERQLPIQRSSNTNVSGTLAPEVCCLCLVPLCRPAGGCGCPAERGVAAGAAAGAAIVGTKGLAADDNGVGLHAVRSAVNGVAGVGTGGGNCRESRVAWTALQAATP